MDTKINVPCTLEQRVSKTGNNYYVLIIKLTNNYEKKVFLEPAERELIMTRASK